MNHHDSWAAYVKDSSLQPWLHEQLALANKKLYSHGDYRRWQQTLEQLSLFQTDQVDLSLPMIQIGNEDNYDEEQRNELKRLLLKLHPWRKGPFNIFGIKIDSEWRSDLKWQRLSNSISALDGRQVLDIGCGNGYYMLRMLGAGAAWVLGVDPAVLFNIQFKALSQFITNEIRATILPIGINQLPDKLDYFDTVFTMGVLYHRRSPLDHLLKVHSLLRPGGELVLETLIIDSRGRNVLVPRARYAKMRNTWFIPSIATLNDWLVRCGFKRIEVVDITATSINEQRTTPWMQFESLADFLDPHDPSKTIEGYPAPVRAIVVAERPS